MNVVLLSGNICFSLHLHLDLLKLHANVYCLLWSANGDLFFHFDLFFIILQRKFTTLFFERP